MGYKEAKNKKLESKTGCIKHGAMHLTSTYRDQKTHPYLRSERVYMGIDINSLK